MFPLALFGPWPSPQEGHAWAGLPKDEAHRVQDNLLCFLQLRPVRSVNFSLSTLDSSYCLPLRFCSSSHSIPVALHKAYIIPVLINS